MKQLGYRLCAIPKDKITLCRVHATPIILKSICKHYVRFKNGCLAFVARYPKVLYNSIVYKENVHVYLYGLI